MKVLIPSPLRPYTQAREVEASGGGGGGGGGGLGEVLVDLDRQFPGIRFRMIDEQDHIRPHMRVFINGAQTFDLAHRLTQADDIQIVQALSGG